MPVVEPRISTVRALRVPVIMIDIVGSGVARGVTGSLGAEVAPQPAPFNALTVKVYVVPLTRLLTVQVSVEVRHPCPPGLAVT